MGQVSLRCAQRHMNSIEASTLTYNTRFTGRIGFLAARGSALVGWLCGTVVCGLLPVVGQLVSFRCICSLSNSARPL